MLCLAWYKYFLLKFKLKLIIMTINMFLAQRQENLYYFIAPIKKNNLYIYITNIDFPLTELVYAKCIYTNYNLYSQSSFFFFGLAPSIRAKVRLILGVHRSSTRSFLQVNHNKFIGYIWVFIHISWFSRINILYKSLVIK
jgi:hypothetical protein